MSSGNLIKLRKNTYKKKIFFENDCFKNFRKFQEEVLFKTSQDLKLIRVNSATIKKIYILT